MTTSTPKKRRPGLSRLKSLLVGSSSQGGKIGTTSSIKPGPSCSVAGVADPTTALQVSSNSSIRVEQNQSKLGLVCFTPDLDVEQVDPRLPDIVAIHGINGDLYKTWTHDNGALWLRDFLPNVTGLRVFSFGYDAKVAFTTSTATPDDFAKSLLSSLGMHRTGKEQPRRPWIFICHSMGGIVLKRAINLARMHPEKYPFVQDAISGIVFLSTPHRGSVSVEWPKLLANILNASLILTSGFHGSTRKDLLRSLERNSPELRTVSDDFSSQVQNTKIISFYEQKKTTIGGALSSLVVDKDSGTLGWPGEMTHPMMGCDHRTVCRFSDRDDGCYQLILHEIKSLVEHAVRPQLVSEPSSNLNQRKTKDEMDCLKFLYFEEMEVRQHDIGIAAEDTCAWLLSHDKFRDWTAQRRGLLWISGNPGAGKSTLLKYAFQKVCQSGPVARSEVVLLSFFFHGRGTELQKTPCGFFRSMLHQILDKVPSASSELVQAFRRNCEAKGDPGKNWSWHSQELRSLFQSALHKILERHSVQIFVDALDECGKEIAVGLVDDLQNLLDCSSTENPSNLSVCFTCRHYPILSLKGGAEICVEHENGNDITTYVHRRLQTFKDQTRDMIIQRASGTFQWVQLVVDRVLELKRNGRPERTIEKEIEQTPQGLNELYRELLGNGNEEEQAELLRFVQWILFAIRPLSLGNLRFAMAIEPELDSPNKSLRQYRDAGLLNDNIEDVERSVKTISRGLAEIRIHCGTRIVQFIHQSVNDFLFKEGLKILQGENWQSIGLAIGAAHYRLSRSCIRFIYLEEISQLQVKDLAGIVLLEETELLELPRRVQYRELKDNLDERAHFPFLEYATSSWIMHAKQSQAEGISQLDLLDYFHWPSNDYIQRWVEIYDEFDLSWDCPLQRTTLLHLVSEHGLIGPLSAALEASSHSNIDIDLKNGAGRTALSLAAGEGHEEVFKLLLDTGKANVDSKADDNRTPLIWAAHRGHEAVVKLLLDTGEVDVDAEDWYNRTPISWAAEKGHEAVAQLLLDTVKVDVDLKDRYGRTPLGYAAREGHEAIAKMLLDTGKVDVDSKDYFNRTPLALAAWGGHKAVAKLLLDTGKVDVDSKDQYDRTPLGYAARGGHEAVAKMLLDTGKVDVDSKDCRNRTPLSWSAWGGHEAVAKLLLETGKVDVNSKDQYDQTPLGYAAREGNEAVAKMLLDTGKVDVNSKDWYSRTPLFWAVLEGHEVVAKLLLDTGNADVNLRDRDYRTPLSLIVENGREAMAKLLLDTSEGRYRLEGSL